MLLKALGHATALHADAFAAVDDTSRLEGSACLLSGNLGHPAKAGEASC